MDDLVERLLSFEGSEDLGNGDFSICARAATRIQALETSLAEAEGRVIAEVVAWLRHPDRRKLIEVEPAKPGYWTNDDEPEWVFSRSALKRLPNHKDFATALETGGWEK